MTLFQVYLLRTLLGSSVLMIILFKWLIWECIFRGKNAQTIRKVHPQIVKSLNLILKFCIRETLTLLTNADRSTNTKKYIYFLLEFLLKYFFASEGRLKCQGSGQKTLLTPKYVWRQTWRQGACTSIRRWNLYANREDLIQKPDRTCLICKIDSLWP